MSRLNHWLLKAVESRTPNTNPSKILTQELSMKLEVFIYSSSIFASRSANNRSTSAFAFDVSELIGISACDHTL